MADLPSILGGMAQGFLDFGKSAVDLFGTGGASIADLIESARTGKVTTKNSDDFRKWLYETDDVKDAAAKGLGTALNGVQTVSDYIPGIGAVTRNPLFNAGQGALGGLADEFKMYGKDYDLGRAGQRAAVGAGGALASTGLADALKGSGNALLKSGTAQGLARGAVGGAIGAGGYAAIDGGSLGDVANSALQGAGMGAALGGTMGAIQDFKPTRAYDMALTDEEKAARIANAKNMLANEQDPERIAELNNQIKDLGGTLADADMAVNSPRYITDENGNPRTLYHGSPNKDITEFDVNQAGKNTRSGERAIYFTDSPEVADEFSYERIPTDDLFVENRGAKGRVYPVNLEMNNPLDLDNLTDAQIDELWPYASYMGSWQGKDVFTRDLKNWRDVNNAQLIKGYLDMDKLASSPYDGFMARMYPNQGNQAREYAVFDNSKVKMLEDVLANDDAAVNGVMESRIAPGQLGLFDDMPTQTPKTGTRQTSLFDQPDNPYLDYYGADIDATPLAPETPANPYAPVDGQVTQAMRDRASEIIDSLALKRQIPDNELFNRIDPSTLPRGQQEIGRILDDKYTRGLKNSDVTDMMRETVSNEFDKRLGKNPSKGDLISFIFGDADETAKKEMMDKAIGLYVAPETMSEGTLNSMARNKISDSLYGDSISVINASNRTVRGGYTGALDSVLSERLGIAPGNTFKKTGPYDSSSSYGRYEEYPFSPYKNNIMVDTLPNNEDAVNTMAHERLHSFQTESKKLYDKGRYSPEVKDAYDELAKDLKSAKAYRTGDEIKKRYGRDVAYWRHHDEQEARMLQQYLDGKGYTGSRHHNENQYLGLEFDDAKITPAFDKFFDKLRDLSKRGVALPALTALFGGGALMANQQKDKEEVK